MCAGEHQCMHVRRGARLPRIKEGSLVRVRKTFHVQKGMSRFQRPARVIRKAGSSAYVLEDGRTWNATHLSLVPESATDVTHPAPVFEPGAALTLGSERSLCGLTIININRSLMAFGGGNIKEGGKRLLPYLNKTSGIQCQCCLVKILCKDW